MKNRILNNKCIKFEKMIPDYFKKNLNKNETVFFESHFKNCEKCQLKYFLMKKIYQNFKKVDDKYTSETATAKNFTINEYENFNKNISAYMDKELNMKDNLAIKKILIKNSIAQETFLKLCRLKMLVKEEFTEYSESIKFREIIRNMYFYMKNFKNSSVK